MATSVPPASGQTNESESINTLDSTVPELDRREAELMKLTSTRDPVELRTLIDGCPELLDDETANRLSQILAGLESLPGVFDHEGGDRDKAFVVDKISWTLGFVRRCREVGTSRAFEELAAGEKFDTRASLSPDDLEQAMGLALAARRRFTLSGDRRALDETINAYSTLMAHPSFGRSRPLFQMFMLDNAGTALLDSYARDRRPEALNSAIELRERAALLTPEDSADYPQRMLELSRAYEDRFDDQHLEADLEASLRSIDVVLGAAKSGSKLCLTAIEALGAHLRKAYRASNRVEWLDREIASYELQLASTELTAEGRVPISVNLGDALRVRYEHSKNPVDLSRAIDCLDEAAPRMPRTQWRPVALGNLGYVLLLRFRATGSRSDLERSIVLFEEALDAPERSSDEAPRLAVWLAESMSEHEVLTGIPADPKRVAALSELIKNVATSGFLKEYDDQTQEATADQFDASDDVTGGLRLFSQNKAMHRLSFEASEKKVKGLAVILALGSLALVFFVLAAIVWALVGLGWVTAIAGILGVAALLFGLTVGAPLWKEAVSIERSLKSEKARVASWDDDEARSIVGLARTSGAPFALFLRGFESEAADRPLNLGEYGPTYLQNIWPGLGFTERDIKTALEGHLPVMAIANPADLLKLSWPESIPRMVLPSKGWQSIVARLMDEAALVLMECRDFSPGILTELGMLLQLEHPRKTIVIIPEEDKDDQGLPLEFAAQILQLGFEGSQSIAPPVEAYPRATKDDLRLKSFPNVIRGSELSWATIEKMKIV